MTTQRPYFIGICGGSASGKTTLLRSILDYFDDDAITLISLDNYYIDKENLPKDLDGEVNFDAPDAVDLDRFARDLARVAAGETVEIEEYTFNNPEIVPKTIVYRPSPIIICEGLFVFHHPDVQALLDLQVFVDAAEHLKLARRIKRDYAERGYSLEEVLDYYEKYVMPMYKAHIEPYKYKCDIILPNNSHMENGTRVLKDHISAVLNGRG